LQMDTLTIHYWLKVHLKGIPREVGDLGTEEEKEVMVTMVQVLLKEIIRLCILTSNVKQLSVQKKMIQFLTGIPQLRGVKQT
jgi:hypothetical protein